MNTNVEKVEYPSFDCIFTGLDGYVPANIFGKGGKGHVDIEYIPTYEELKILRVNKSLIKYYFIKEGVKYLSQDHFSDDDVRVNNGEIVNIVEIK